MTRTAHALLWILALVLTVAAAGHQRRTGPTHDFETRVPIDGALQELVLPRSGTTTRTVEVVIPGGVAGELHWRRYPTSDPYTRVNLREGRATIPVQPAAGKVEYYLTLGGEGESVRVPAQGRGADGTRGGEDTLILRYKDPVPASILVAHILLMFAAMLVGVRAALGAAVTGEAQTRLIWLTLGGITVGGMVLGPIVQKYAFGAYWTGFPLGTDLTDNKTLLMWMAWMVPAGLLLAGRRGRDPWLRSATVLAALVMVAVYLVPHSLRGSEFDYGTQSSTATVSTRTESPD